MKRKNKKLQKQMRRKSPVPGLFPLSLVDMWRQSPELCSFIAVTSSRVLVGQWIISVSLHLLATTRLIGLQPSAHLLWDWAQLESAAAVSSELSLSLSKMAPGQSLNPVGQLSPQNTLQASAVFHTHCYSWFLCLSVEAVPAVTLHLQVWISSHAEGPISGRRHHLLLPSFSLKFHSLLSVSFNSHFRSFLLTNFLPCLHHVAIFQHQNRNTQRDFFSAAYDPTILVPWDSVESFVT